MSERDLIKDLMWFNVLVAGLFHILFLFPLLTSVIVVVTFDLLAFGIYYSPNFVRETVAINDLMRHRSTWPRMSFVSLLGGNVLFFGTCTFLAFTGIYCESPDTIVSMLFVSHIVHVIIGSAVVLVCLCYAGYRIHIQSVRWGSLKRAVWYEFLDFIAGLAILSLVLFGFQLLPVILMFLLTLGVGCLVVIGVVAFITARSGRFESRMEWAREWFASILSTPLVIVIAYIFGYGPFRPRMEIVDEIDYHFRFALAFWIILVLCQIGRVVYAATTVGTWRSRRAIALSGLGKILATIAVAFVLLRSLQLVGDLIHDPRGLYDYLLPLSS